MKNMQSDCELVSKKNNISFTWNSKFPINSLYLMRGYLYVSDDQKNNYLNTFFDAYWKNNLDLSNDIEVSQLLKTLDIDNKKFLNGIKEQSIKNSLKDSTNEAFEKEVFGAPTFIANNKIFWGQDRIEYAVEELNFN
jgi:2-hydroxychromene-2-carboxylate isomerase